MTTFFRGHVLFKHRSRQPFNLQLPKSRWAGFWSLAKPIASGVVLCLSTVYPVHAATEVSASNQANFVIAGADNFNPGLELLPPKLEQFGSVSAPTEASSKVGLESLKTDFRNDRDSSNQRNRFLEETAQFRLQNGNIVLSKTGLNAFKQTGIEPVTNIPIQVGWGGKFGQVKVQALVGVDLFDRLPIAPNFSIQASLPILPNVTLSGVLEKEPYKFNAKALSNQISALRFGPTLYWQIDRNTSLFSFCRRGNYSDGNHEHQSFTRLERKFGQFSVSANLFTWNYENNALERKGYFSPQDFLVYNGEIGWEGDVFKFLRCGLTASLGRQRLKGDLSSANTYQAHCMAQLSPRVEAGLGYTFSNVRTQGTGDSSNSQALTGQLRITF
ncbi:MAG: hypothetical protein LH660_06895 [Phormidesmis sp. CAN_BIN36]|nr:hypothetical protein [Phormidesmis sp. CAN_BIN36]